MGCVDNQNMWVFVNTLWYLPPMCGHFEIGEEMMMNQYRLNGVHNDTYPMFREHKSENRSCERKFEHSRV